MRYAIGLMVLVWTCAFSIAAQDVVPSEEAMKANWSKLGPTVEGQRGFTLHGKGIRINRGGQYELWVKIVPSNTYSFNRRYDLPQASAYVLQYATVDCEKKLLYFERTAAYGSDDRPLTGNFSSITPSSKKDMVKPGSIGEALYRFVCVETTTLPMTKTLE